MVQPKVGPWSIEEIKNVPQNGLKVFSCFHCAGGSTMGYKLAGYEVLGGVEIDPEMMKIYRANHQPKHSFLMGVQDFNKIGKEKLPKELFELDILDGSPPCSSFSVAGNREKAWGKKKKFREGQTEQILDDLFFHFIETAKKLQPKIVIAENVKGLLFGKAKGYVKQIFQMFQVTGYDVQLFLLNASSMGVPQKRERTFFVARRKDLCFPKIKLSFIEKPISVFDSWRGLQNQTARPLTDFTKKLWEKSNPGESMARVNNGNGFNNIKCEVHRPASTIAANNGLYHPTEPRYLSDLEIYRLQTFPDDFKNLGTSAQYICGMSVPPFMMQRIALSIKSQLFDQAKVERQKAHREDGMAWDEIRSK